MIIEVICFGRIWSFNPQINFSLKMNCSTFTRSIFITSPGEFKDNRESIEKLVRDSFSTEEMKRLNLLKKEDILIEYWQINYIDIDESMTLSEYFKFKRDKRHIIN